MKKINVFSFLLILFTAFSMNAQTVSLTVPDKLVNPGEWFTIGIKASDFDNIASMQYAIQWNPDIIEFQSVTGLNSNMPDFTAINSFNIAHSAEGRLRVSWYWFDPVTSSGVSLDDNATLFNINFKAVGGMGSNTMLEITDDTTVNPPFVIEIANFDQEVAVNIDNGKVTISGTSASEETYTEDFTLFQNSPNPFSEITYISFNLNSGDNAKLTIFDSSGKAVFSQNKKFPAGISRIPVRRDMLSSAGTYFYTLETARATATRQLIMQ
ncbi:MAG: T9SS type A sorting domain-containing protein [Bacteroidetes bacterium]|nr:T9SS type A sorting domain-containing protein [Bacteroidota bacterium]